MHLSSETDDQIWRYQDPKTPSEITYERPKNLGSKKCSSVTSKEISNVSKKYEVDEDEIFTGKILQYHQLQQPDLFEVLDLESTTSYFISLGLVKEKIPGPIGDF